MSNVSISSPFFGGVTIIPNQFIEYHMIHANGEFVKIYLYLMHVSENHKDFSLDQIADALNCTESDVLRALRYWEKEGLLSILPVNSRKPDFVSLTMPLAVTDTKRLDSSAIQVAAAGPHESSVSQITSDTDRLASSAVPAASDTDRLPSSAVPVTSDTDIPASPAVSATAATQSSAHKPERRTLTADKVRQLKENSEIAELLFIAQQYMGKPLSPMDTSRILYFYEELQFSTDLIEYLIEYCVSKGHRSMNYIEKVAFAWKDNNITDVAAAKKSCENYHKDYYTILKALGIRGRNPIDAEIAIMKTWMQEYGFTLDIIVEACTRTILSTKQPSLQYADRILQTWKEANVHTISDIRKLDLKHEQSRPEKPAPKSQKGTNRFSNFEQRSYDYSSLEGQLLNR